MRRTIVGAVGLLALLSAGCGGGGSGPVPVEPLLLLSGASDYRFPVMQPGPQGPTLYFRTDSAIYSYPMFGVPTEPRAIASVGDENGFSEAAIRYGADGFYTDGNFFGWLAGDTRVALYKLNPGVIREVPTIRPIVPGFCVNDDALVYLARDNNLFVRDIDNPQPGDPPAFNLQPLFGSVPVRSFMCLGDWLAAATATKVYLFNYDPATLSSSDIPDIQPLATEEANGLFLTDRYLAWVTPENRIVIHDRQDGARIPVNTQAPATPLIDDLRLDGSTLVWSDTTNGNYDVWMFDFVNSIDGLPVQITTESAEQRHPAGLDGSVVWSDGRSGGPLELWALIPSE